MVFPPQLGPYAFVFLIACLIAYWRTLWFGKRYHIPVAACTLLSMASLIGIVLLSGDVWKTRSWQSFGLLAVPAAGYVLTEWWSLRLKRQQKADNAVAEKERPCEKERP